MNDDDVFEPLRSSAAEPYIGEPVSQLDHALQCAALAARARADDALVVAALFHDIGHLCAPTEAERMPGLGVADHESIGAAWLADRGFRDDVVWLVRNHVAAKRYLVATRADYAAKLSEASKATLVLQGGAMDAAEIVVFERAPRFRDALRLRAWDEQAKEIGWSGPDLDSYRSIVARVRT